MPLVEFTGNLRPEAYVEYKDGARTVRIYDVTYQSLVNNSWFIGEASDDEKRKDDDQDEYAERRFNGIDDDPDFRQTRAFLFA